MMNKRGLSLVEMLAIIGLLGMLIVIVVPTIIHLFNEQEKEIEQVSNEVVSEVVKLYIEQKPNSYSLYEGDIYCLLVNDLIEEEYLILGFIQDSKYYVETDILEVKVLKNKQISVMVNSGCQPKSGVDFYHDDSGAERPVIKDNLIPIKFDVTGIIKADISEQWYDYEIKQWANAVLVTDESYSSYQGDYTGLIDEEDILGHFVWIPRFRYQLFNVESSLIAEESISVRFENIRSVKATNEENGKWHTHPAFSFGSKELTGFWFGKFTTTGTNSIVTVLENSAMLRNQYIADHYTAIGNFQLNFDLLNTRISKNTEWGAVVYLANSIYGNEVEIWSNPNSGYLTGCAGNTANPGSTATCNQFDSENGLKASTTGNVYGVYDMSGGSYESVMGVMLELSGVLIDVAESTFSEINQIEKKYLNLYLFGTTYNDSDAYQRRVLGDATSETRNWFSNDQEFIYHQNSFFLRGGNINNPGIFSFNYSPGNITSGFRITISEE